MDAPHVASASSQAGDQRAREATRAPSSVEKLEHFQSVAAAVDKMVQASANHTLVPPLQATDLAPSIGWLRCMEAMSYTASNSTESRLGATDVCDGAQHTSPHDELLVSACTINKLSGSRSKIRVDALLAKHAELTFPDLPSTLAANASYILLLLDAPNILSTKALAAAFPALRTPAFAGRVCIPQADPAHYAQMVSESRMLFNVRFQRLDTWLAANALGGLRVPIFFADYETSIYGRRSMQLSPLQDLQRFFRYRYPAPSCLVGVTLSYRSPHKLHYPAAAPVLTHDDLVGFMQYEAACAGMVSELLECFRYGMVFSLFLLTQREDVLKSESCPPGSRECGTRPTGTHSGGTHSGSTDSVDYVTADAVATAERVTGGSGTKPGPMAVETIWELIHKRGGARLERNFQLADSCREQLRAAGVSINDRTQAWVCADGRKGLPQAWPQVDGLAARDDIELPQAWPQVDGLAARDDIDRHAPLPAHRPCEHLPTRSSRPHHQHWSSAALTPHVLKNIRPRQARLIHGHQHVTRRWRELGFVVANDGTRQALALTREILSDSGDSTLISILSINRCEAEIPCYQELCELSRCHPSRVRVAFSLTEAPEERGWTGFMGKGDAAMGRAALPSPLRYGAAGGTQEDRGVMVLVCGKVQGDIASEGPGLVELWGGPMGNPLRMKGKSQAQRVQGALGGILKVLSFTSDQVFQYDVGSPTA